MIGSNYVRAGDLYEFTSTVRVILLPNHGYTDSNKAEKARCRSFSESRKCLINEQNSGIARIYIAMNIPDDKRKFFLKTTYGEKFCGRHSIRFRDVGEEGLINSRAKKTFRARDQRR